MQYRKFGNTDLIVSEVGFGAWAIGGAAQVGSIPIGWGEADDRESAAAVKAALAAGINFFDTADFYGLGHSEALLGHELKNEKGAIIATKVGQRQEGNSIVIDYSYDYLKKACEQSLRRLQREHIDYYQLHAARMQHLENGECIRALEDLKKAGKIRYWGLSLNTFHPAPEADYLMEHGYADGFQLVFNLVNQRSLPVMEKAAAKGYGLIARMPLQFGLLTGKFSRQSQFGKNDHRSFRLTGEVLDAVLSILEQKVWSLAEGTDKTALALGFILSHPQISTVIPGIRTVQHVRQNTTGIPMLNKKQLEKLHSLAQSDWARVMETMERLG
jgi:aryl-alcohol dehydrogenase-like predicted oxidoreductase